MIIGLIIVMASWLDSLVSALNGSKGAAVMKDAVSQQISESNCVVKALHDAKKWKEKTGEDAMIAISRIEDDGSLDHAQAYVQRNGRMIPLTSDNSDLKVREYAWHYPQRPYRVVSVQNFIKEQKENLSPMILKYLTDE
jgi:hypothetical protein